MAALQARRRGPGESGSRPPGRAGRRAPSRARAARPRRSPPRARARTACVAGTTSATRGREQAALRTAAAERVARGAVFEVDGVDRAPAPQVEQRQQPRRGAPRPCRPRTRAAQAARRSRCRRRARTSAQGSPGIRGRRLARARSPPSEADDRGRSAEAETLEEHHLHDRRALRAVDAQVGDRLAALRHGEEHRVEREQQPEQRRDHGEERARLVRRGEAPGAAARRPRRPLATSRRPPASACSSLAHGASCPGFRLHEHARDAAAQAGESCRLCERHDRRARWRERSRRLRGRGPP